MTTNLAKEPMKSSVWRPRAKHHTTLLIDGLCKHRCLFKDYDDTFMAKEEDYNKHKIMFSTYTKNKIKVVYGYIFIKNEYVKNWVLEEIKQKLFKKSKEYLNIKKEEKWKNKLKLLMR